MGRSQAGGGGAPWGAAAAPSSGFSVPASASPRRGGSWAGLEDAPLGLAEVRRARPPEPARGRRRHTRRWLNRGRGSVRHYRAPWGL